MVSSHVYLFGFNNDERPEDPEADPDYVPPETESETSWSDDSELSASLRQRRPGGHGYIWSRRRAKR